MLVIFIAIDPVELQALREFGSEADFVSSQRGNYLKYDVGYIVFENTCGL